MAIGTEDCSNCHFFYFILREKGDILMAKQLNIDLSVRADTSQAKQAFQDLQKSLSNVAKLPGNSSSLFDDRSIREASEAAMELQRHLNNAVNVDTGKLDLSRFSASLKAGKKDLSYYSQTLLKTGDSGRQAFLQLAQAISSADVPVARLNKKVAELGTVLKNTARWQLSSSILHGFMGAVQNAYGYAQDLNKSLNNIRIVTGANSSEMAKFAEQANKAAKALSTTTTEYTDAALIYYQQGDTGEEVLEKADVTVQMANVTGQSAQEVSDQLTAIWNNFNKAGEESYERYADVLTALGAATASSTDEISQGLEKFAAVADTIGLSYDYATSALATVTATTRESADVVGTAFKTIFARMEGLKFGDSLEDGTTLNDYTEALYAVGVNIKDSNGELKDMDTILREMAGVWQTLNKDEQVALAQKVGGLRQYNQLIALMDNWDFMEENLKVAKEATGTLSLQADIYAQSWEAAQDRVTAAAENIYDSLINDEFFIDLLNGFEKILEGVGGFVDGLGGMGGVIRIVSSLFLTAFAQKIPDALQNLKQNFMVFTGQARTAMMDTQKQLDVELGMAVLDPGAANNNAYKTQLEGIAKVNEMKQKLVASSKLLSESEKEEYQQKIKNVQELYEEVSALQEKKDALEKLAKKEREKAMKSAEKTATGKLESASKEQQKQSNLVESYDKQLKEVEERRKALGDIPIDSTDESYAGAIQELTELNVQYDQLLQKKAEATIKSEELKTKVLQTAEAYGLTEQEALEFLNGTRELTPEQLEAYKKKLEETTTKYTEMIGTQKKLEDFSDSIVGQGEEWSKAAKKLLEYNESMKKNSSNTKFVEKNISSMKTKMSDYLKIIQDTAKENGIEIAAEDIEKLSGYIKNLSIDNIEDATKAFDEFAQSLSGKVTDAIEETGEKIDELRDDLEELDMSADSVDGIGKMAEEIGELDTKITNSKDNIDGFGNEAPQAGFKASEAFANFASSVTSASMVVSSIQNAISVFSDESASGFEKVGAAISILTSVMSAFNAVQAFATTLSKKESIAKAAQIIMEKLHIVTKTGETTAVVANTAAWLANPIMWIAVVIVGVIAVLGLLIAGIAKLTEWLIKGNKIETENCDTLIENAEKTKELAEANEELSDSIDTLIDDFKDLQAEGENTAETLAKIKEQMPGLIQSYRDFANQTGLDIEEDINELERLANLGALTGDYSGFESKKAEIDKEVAVETAKAAKSGATASSTVLASAMQETQGKVTGSSYKLHVGGAQGAGAKNDEADAVNILAEEMGSYATKTSDTGIDLKVDNYADPVQMVDYYEKMVAARDRMLEEMSDEQLAESDTFREINEMIGATAEQYEKAKEQANEYIQVAGKGIEAEVGTGANIETMDEYLKYKEEFIKKATEEYGLSQEQAEAYLRQSENLGLLNQKYELGAQVAEKFFDVENFGELGEKAQQEYFAIFDEMVKGFSEDELALAVNVIADVDSIEEFEREMERISAQADVTRYENMSGQLSTMLSSSQERKSFSSADISSLERNEDFNQFLGDSGETFDSFEGMDYEEQYNMIAEFYSKVQSLKYESQQYQKELYYEDLAEQQELLDKMYDMTEEEQQKSLEMKEEYAKKQAELNKEGISQEEKDKIQAELDAMESEYENTFGWSIELDSTDVKSKMDEIQDKIKEMDKQQIQLAIEWDGIDEIEGAYKNVSAFAKTMQKDALKVGDSYQLTAAQAREWMEVYPELFSQATTTSDGLIQLDQSVVDEYINGQEAEVDATADAKIEQLKAERTAMEAKLKLVEADLEAAYNNYTGQEELANVSAEYLADTRKNLTQYYMDLGMDEVNADAAALETMGLNEEEYTNLVAEAAEKNANNQIDSSEAGGKAQSQALSKLAEKWKKFTTLLKQVGAAVKAALTGGDVQEAWTSVSEDFSIQGVSFQGEDLSGHTFKDLDEQQITAARETVNSQLAATLEQNKAEIQKALGSIDSQITYLEGLKNQDLADYGSTDPEDVSGGGSGGGSSDNKKTIEELTEIAERYHEITKEVETLEHQLDLLGKQKERAYGKNKLKLMDEENEKLKQLAEKQKELLDAQTLMLAVDKAAVQDAFTGATFDKDGNISNYSELEEQATQALNAAKQKFNASAQEDGDKEALEAAEKEYEKKMKLLEQYEETLDGVRQSEAAYQEAFMNWQDSNFEKLNYKLELKIDINDDKLEMADYYLGKMSDDVYSMGESLALMTGDKLTALLAQGKAYEEQQKQLENAFKAGEISEDQYYQGLDEIKDSLLANATALKELDDQTIAYYGETLKKAKEEIDSYISKMKDLNSVLEHYETILDLSSLHKTSADYFKQMDTVLDGQLKTTQHQLESAKASMELFQDELIEKEAAYKKALEDEDQELIEITKKQYEDALAVATEAEEEYLSKVEDYANQVNKILEHNLKKFANSLENQLTGGTSFSQMNTSMDRFVSLHDEYLTTTNKIYETTKLMNTAQKEIDKTSNTVAKNKMKQFIQETQNLQNQTKLSQFELDIQQAKYDLLVAEIALEEAQNAKSQVRLQRDSEGNFGYVYTADQQIIQNAEQQYLDAQNKLYNVGLEGANNYVQKYQQTMSEMYDTLTSLAEQYRNGEFESEEEYQNAVKEAKEYYYEKLGQYSYLHYQAIQTDSAVATDYILSDSNLARTGITGDTISVGDAWRETFLNISGFGEDAKAALTGSSWETYQATKKDLENMTGDAESWKTAVEGYVENVSKAFDDWKTQTETYVTPVIENLGIKVGEIVSKSEELKKALVGDDENQGVIDDLKDEIDKVNKLTGEYLALRDALLDAITKAETLAKKINEDKEDASGVKEDKKQPEQPKEPEQPKKENPPVTKPDPPVEPVTDPENDGNFKIGDKVKFTGGYYYHDSSGSYPRGSRGPGKEVTVQNINPGAKYPIAVKSNDSAYGWLTREQLSRFNTGGYTGDWDGPYGKIAVLDKKELILNEKDTENFLASLGLLDSILSMIDLQSETFYSAGNLVSPSFQSGFAQESLEQNVQIEAHFPNVTNKEEIEDAFKDLVNLASQYANRK